MVTGRVDGQLVQPAPGTIEMPEISTEVVALLRYLAPGFLVTWVYFGLTSHERPSQFERTVQALIYTAVVQALVAFEKQFTPDLAEWNSPSQSVAAVVSALSLGLVMATAVNHDLVHVVLRKLRVTRKTSHPCEWFSDLSENSQFVVLHLKDETQVHGWPSIWPSNGEKGHFYVTDVIRKTPKPDRSISRSDALMINVADVAFVEFVASMEKRDERAPQEKDVP